MRTNHLFYAMLLLSLTACQKNLSPKTTSLSSADSKASVNPFASADYVVSGFTAYTTDSAMVQQASFTYNPNGTYRHNSMLTTTRNKNVIVSTSTLTVDYTYLGDTVVVTDKRITPSQNTAITVHSSARSYKDSLGRIVRAVQITYSPVTGNPGTPTETRYAYNSNGQLVSATTLPSSPGGSTSVTSYLWSNGNLIEAYYTGGNIRYTYYADQLSQPGDLSNLSSATSGGLLPTNAGSLTQSCVEYGQTNQFQLGDQYTYEFDSKGRISKATDLYSSTTPQNYQPAKFYTIQYLNN